MSYRSNISLGPHFASSMPAWLVSDGNTIPDLKSRYTVERLLLEAIPSGNPASIVALPCSLCP
jgi:hypothetical protein